MARDPANTQWQTDLVISFAKLGTMADGQNAELRRVYLQWGRAILVVLKGEGRLLSNRDWIEWFDNQLTQLKVESV